MKNGRKKMSRRREESEGERRWNKKFKTARPMKAQCREVNIYLRGK